MQKHKLAWPVFVVLLLLSLAGCGGGAAPGGAPARPDAPGLALPAPHTLRGASSTEIAWLWGNAYGAGLPNNRVQPYNPDAVFVPAWQKGGDPDGLAYATYQFQLDGAGANPRVMFSWNGGDDYANAWVGLADFTRDRWDWSPLPESNELPYDPAACIAPDGRMYVVVLMTGTEGWALQQVAVKSSPGGNWSAFGHDARRTHLSSATGPQTGQLKWSYLGTGAGRGFTPAAIDFLGIIYVGNETQLLALNPDGTRKWSAPVDHPAARPALGSAAVYVQSRDGVLHAFNSTTGDALWSFDTGTAYQSDSFAAPAVGPEGNIYTGNSLGELIAVGADGSELWRYTIAACDIPYATVAGDGTVYAINSSSTDLYALSSSGVLNWSLPYMYGISTPPAIGPDGTVYITDDYSGSLSACSAAGTALWTVSAGLPYSGHSGMAFIPGGALVVCMGQQLSTYNALGICGWNVTLPQRAAPSPLAVTSTGEIYVAMYDGINHNNGSLSAYSSTGGLDWSTPFTNCELTGPASTPDGWPVFGAAIRSGTEAVTQAMLIKLDNIGALYWAYGSGARRYASPAIADDGTVYSGGWDCTLGAFDPDGTQRWSYMTGNVVWSSPAIAQDGTIYAGSDDGCLYAFRPDGGTKWQYATGGAVRSSPVIGSDGTVYVATRAGKLLAVAFDGQLRWSYDLQDVVGASPALAPDGTIYIGDFQGRLNALSPDGALQWSFATSDAIDSAPAVAADGTVYFTTCLRVDGNPEPYGIYAINPDGTQKWFYGFTSECYASPALGPDGTVYIGANDGIFRALSVDGALLWSADLGAPVASSAAVDALGNVYVGCGNLESPGPYKLAAFTPGGGALWSYDTPGAIMSSPAIAQDGTLYVGTMDGSLLAFGD